MRGAGSSGGEAAGDAKKPPASTGGAKPAAGAYREYRQNALDVAMVPDEWIGVIFSHFPAGDFGAESWWRKWPVC
jgi:hypothetical protein